MNKTILITGGAGFIGSCYVLQARQRGERVINLDKLTYAGNPENLAELEQDKDYIFVQGDIGNAELVRWLLQTYRPDAVLNFAAESHVDRSIVDPEAFVRTNVLGTATLLRVVSQLQKREAYTADFNLHMDELETYFGHKLKKGDTLPRELFLTAPMDGTIIDISPRTRSRGRVDPNTAAVTMAVLDPIQIQIQVYESEVSRMHIGQEVSVDVVNMGGKKVRGKISMLSWMPIDATIAVPSFYFVYIDIENPDHMIRPGYKALVHIDVE